MHVGGGLNARWWYIPPPPLQAFFPKLEFSPGRYRTNKGVVVSPFGSYSWKHVTLYEQYQQTETTDPNIWDIAVIKINASVGYATGWMGMQKPCR